MTFPHTLFKFVFFHPVQLLVLLTTVAFLLRFKVRPWFAWTVTVLGGLAFVISTFAGWPGGGDLAHFYVAGCDVLDGIDPYRHECVVWPPTGFPIFALFASLPFATILAIWTIVNML